MSEEIKKRGRGEKWRRRRKKNSAKMTILHFCSNNNSRKERVTSVSVQHAGGAWRYEKRTFSHCVSLNEDSESCQLPPPEALTSAGRKIFSRTRIVSQLMRRKMEKSVLVCCAGEKHNVGAEFRSVKRWHITGKAAKSFRSRLIFSLCCLSVSLHTYPASWSGIRVKEKRKEKQWNKKA